MFSVLTIFIGIVTYGLCKVVRRLFFHPLSKFPGPRAAAATYWYEFYHDIIAGDTPGKNVFNIDQLHEAYGPIVRINPNELSVSDPDWYDVLYNSGRRDKYLKNHKANGSPGSVASTVSREHHRQRRAPLTQFFSKRSIENLDTKIRANVDLMTRGIASQCLGQQPFQIGVAFTALTLDVITDYCFGESFRCLIAPGFAPDWKRAMTGLFEPVPIVKQFPWINQVMMALPQTVLQRIAPDMLLFFGAKAACDKQISRIMTEREMKGVRQTNKSGTAAADDQTPSTVFHAILDSSLPDAEKTLTRLSDEGFVMIVAGGETTAKALTIAVYHLLANPKWLRKVVKELDNTIPDKDVLPNWSTLEKLPALGNIVKETLRISSPVTNRLQLTAERTQPLQYREWAIPAGTPVSMSIPAIHLNQDIFPDPHTFDPSRWEGEQGKVLTKYYLPFGRGSRACLGSNLAYAELYLGLAAVFRRFELELFDVMRERDVDVVRDCFVGMPSPQSQGVRVKVLRSRP